MGWDGWTAAATGKWITSGGNAADSPAPAPATLPTSIRWLVSGPLRAQTNASCCFIWIICSINDPGTSHTIAAAAARTSNLELSTGLRDTMLGEGPYQFSNMVSWHEVGTFVFVI